MIRKIRLIGIFLLAAGWVTAQNTRPDSLLRYYRQYPQAAIDRADRLFQEARKSRNNLQLLQALMLKTTYTLEINRDRYPELIGEAEKLARQEQEPATQCLLYSYLGQLYLQYYQANRYDFDQRTALKDTVPADLKSWSGNLFRDKIVHYFLASLSPASRLQELPIGQYRPILITAPDSFNLRPTLYDFLCHRAIEYLDGLDSGTRELPEPVQQGHALTPLPDFLLQSFPAGPISHTILHIYQDLLRFQQRSNPQQALLMTDLERIDYAYRLSPQDTGSQTAYVRLLQDLAVRYAGTPLVVEVWYRQADFILRHPATPQLRALFVRPPYKPLNSSPQLALEICEDGLRRYPAYHRIGLLHDLIKQIRYPSLQIAYSSSIYPGKNGEIAIQYQNVGEITLEISRVDQDMLSYENTYWKNKAPRQTVFKQVYRLSNSIARQDTLVPLPALKPGLYQINAQSPQAKKSIPGYFVCSRLFPYQHIYGNEYRFYVRDGMSGKPAAQAKIYLYRDGSPSSRRPTDSLLTDRQGMAVTRTKAERFQVVDAGNPAGLLYRFNTPSPQAQSLSGQHLITDRKLYRPGQTVHFKGIGWTASPDTLFPLTRHTHLVQFLNPQGKNIKQISLRSNEFGSFTGSFTIPAQTLNGTYTLMAGRHHASIQIENYKRPEMEIMLESAKNSYHIGDSVFIQGRVISLSGIPLENQAVRYTLSMSPMYSWHPVSIHRRQGQMTTDRQGKFRISFPAESAASMPATTPYLYRISATATDPKGETQQGELCIRILPGKYRPLIQMAEKVNKEIPAEIRLSLEDFPADSRAREIRCRIEQLQSPDTLTPFPAIRDTIVKKTVWEGKLRCSGHDSIRPLLKNNPSGAYLLSVDCEGVSAKKIFYLYAPDDKTPPIPTYNWLVQEKTACRPGEKARILFGTSASQAHVNYTLYHAKGVILSKNVVLSNRVIPLEFTYLPEYGDQIGLTISYVRDGRYICHDFPIKRLRENQTLRLTTQVFRDRLTPGQTEEWQIRINQSNGQPADAEVLAMMYDASLDKLCPYFLPSFHPQYLRSFLLYNQPGRYTDITAKEKTLGIYQWLTDTASYPWAPWIFNRLNTYEPSGLRTPGLLYSKGVNEGYRMALSESAVLSDRQMDQAAASDRRQEKESSGEPAPALFPVSFRKNFHETAFFYPQLHTDSLGEVRLKFTVPDAMTRWKFFAQAHTRQLAAGQLERYATTSRELMVRPNMPRFLRSGDRTELKVTVSNLSDRQQQGRAVLEWFAPATDSLLLRREIPFRLPAQNHQTLCFRLEVPRQLDCIGCRISASTPQFSDGEQHLLPVLPDRTLVTQTQPIFTAQHGTHQYTLIPQTAARQDYRLTFEFTANPAWYAVLALPTLTSATTDDATGIAASLYANAISSQIARSHPEIEKAIRIWNQQHDQTTLLSKLEQNAELKSILLEASPWQLEARNETERMQTLAQLFDRNRQQYLQEQGLNKLKELQTPSGGWSWFKNMPASPFITCRVLSMLARMNTIGAQEFGEATRKMQMRGIRYLDNLIRADFKDKPDQLPYRQLLYLYVRSMYPDLPLGDALEAHRHYLSLAGKQWGEFSFYEKAIAAVTLHRYGIPHLPEKILKSLRQYAVTTPQQGMYWPNNRNTAYRNSAVQVHTAIMEAFAEIQGATAELTQMKQWLLLQKQTQAWPDAPATADAIYTLLHADSCQLHAQEFPQITLGNRSITPPPDQNPLGYLQQTYSAPEIQPDMLTVKIEQATDRPSWGALYLQSFERLEEIRPSSGSLQIQKQLFLEQTEKDGKKALLPINGQTLKIGDKLIVRLTFSLDRDMEFLHLKDLRAACFEPEEQRSGVHWKFNTVYYEAVQDAATNFFFYALNRGTYVIEYPVRINQEGIYQDGIATFQSAYAPEFNAFSPAQKIEIKK